MEMITLPSHPSLTGLARLIPDVIYSTETGIPLKGALMMPEVKSDSPFPAILFVQGSGFTFPDIGLEIPQLARYAQAGYVVMTITHRHPGECKRFPVFLEDVKCAIRYLRANAEKYHLDPERIGIFGTSSGANAALLAGMTAQDSRYRTGEYNLYSDHVKCVVDCYGPTMLEEFRRFSDVSVETLREMSPLLIADEGKKYPPILILHGDQDQIVHYDQSVRFYEKLKEMGKDVKMVCVQGADHGHASGFWSEAVHQLILTYFNERL